MVHGIARKDACFWALVFSMIGEKLGRHGLFRIPTDWKREVSTLLEDPCGEVSFQEKATICIWKTLLLSFREWRRDFHLNTCIKNTDALLHANKKLHYLLANLHSDIGSLLHQVHSPYNLATDSL
jgi:hypothetical protein